MHEHDKLGAIEWAVAGRPLPGQDVSGDNWIVADAGGGSVLIGVIDGLGHGAPAAIAARRAVAVLTDNPAEPLDVLMVLCHRALGETRGAAISLALMSPDDKLLRWMGVGNVSAQVVGVAPGGPATRASALVGGGIVGYHLPTHLQPQTIPIQLGDMLIMATDGIAGDHLDGIDLAKPATLTVDDILTRRAKDTDDALVLAARHRGTPK